MMPDSAERWTGFACVIGQAAGMGSKRAFVPATGKMAGRPVIVDANQAMLRSWQREMKAAMAECAPPEPLDCAVAVQVRVYVERPLWHYRKGKAGRLLKLSAPSVPASGRDLDKILRAVLDCGTGLWWRDDSRVARAMIERLWADGTTVRTSVWGFGSGDAAPRPAVGQVEMQLAERE